MEEKWVRLSEALQKYPGLSKIPIAYKPVCDYVTFTPKETGYDCLQAFQTTLRLEWKPFFYPDGQLCLISSTTSANILLKGKLGAKNAKSIMQRYCNIYVNETISTDTKPLDISTFEILPQNLKIADPCWLADIFHCLEIKVTEQYSYRGAYYAKNNHIWKATLFESGGIGKKSEAAFGMRVIVTLDPKTYVCISDIGKLFEPLRIRKSI